MFLNTSGSALLNDPPGSQNLTLTFTALGAGAAQTVTVNQAPATGSTVFTAGTGGGCAGVASIAGSTTASTSAGPTGSFVVTPIAIAPAGVCTFSISSSIQGKSATITVDTSGA